MLSGMTGAEQSEAFRILKTMIRSLRDGGDGAARSEELPTAE
jgi:hypothetical protein